MSTIRNALSKWGLIVTGLLLILMALQWLFALAVPPVILGVLALIAGIGLLAST